MSYQPFDPSFAASGSAPRRSQQLNSEPFPMLEDTNRPASDGSGSPPSSLLNPAFNNRDPYPSNASSPPSSRPISSESHLRNTPSGSSVGGFYREGQSRRQAAALAKRNRGSRLSQTQIGIMQGTVGSGLGRFPSEASFGSNESYSERRRRNPQSHQSFAGLDFASIPTISARMPPMEYHQTPSRTSLASDVPDYNMDNLANPSAVEVIGEKSPEPGPDALIWNEKNVEDDDWLHDPEADINPKLARVLQSSVGPKARAQYHAVQSNWSSSRGWVNTIILGSLLAGLMALFLFGPLYLSFVQDRIDGNKGGFRIGGVNGSGQMPVIAGFSGLRDRQTPQEALSRKGFDGSDYELVFSDEFNVDGRTFWPGDDPFWEAVNLHYWATSDLEWYDPDAIVTRDGNLVITQSQQPIHDLNFRSGMLQSWNKFCFTGGYIEVNMSLPGDASHPGFWVGAWTIGNLVRPGYGASAEGVWPYSYNDCDVGTYPRQMRPDGTPTAAATSGDPNYGGALSQLPGQKLSACTCSEEDHPGPNPGVGRGGPEIDIIEAKTGFMGGEGADLTTPIGAASQSIQIGPMDDEYSWSNGSDALTIYDPSNTKVNTWHGTVTQESLSIDSGFNDVAYQGQGYETFGFEYQPGDNGHITWAIGEEPTAQLTSKALGANEKTEISQRPIAEEPMSIVLNFAISTKFEFPIAWGDIQWPAELLIDYVRVYQKADQFSGDTLSCDPKDRPTAEYIQKHPIAYQNANMTTWNQTGYAWPKNKGYSGC